MVFPKVETEQNIFVLSRLHSKSVENTAFLGTEVGITKSISSYVHFLYNLVTGYTLNFILGVIQMNKTIRIETLIDRTVECMLALGLSPNSVYGGLYGRLEAVRRYYCKHNEEYYSPALMEQFLQELNQRYATKEIHKSHYLKLRKSAERIMEVYETGTLTWSMRKPKAKYMVSNEDSVLLDEFLQWGAFHRNTGNDYSWVVRRYLTYLHNHGIQNISEVQNTDIAFFILSCAKEVSRGSLRNILSYTKKFHFFLRETGRLPGVLHTPGRHFVSGCID